MGERGRKPLPKGELTACQKEVLQLFSNGLDYRGVAQELSISHKTVLMHTEHIRNRLDASTLAHAVKIGVLKQWIV